MLHIDFTYYNRLLSSSTSWKNASEVSSFRAKSFYLEKVFSRGQGFAELPYNTEISWIVAKAINWITSQTFETIVFVGIGGSMLGTQTIIETLTNYYTKSKLLCIDNLSTDKIKEILELSNPEKTLFIIQSKSGNTPEIVAQYSVFKEFILSRGLLAKNHFVFVTDPNSGFLRKESKESDILALPIPKNVGGRFSVLSPIGLLVCGLLGGNNQQLLAGAGDANEDLYQQAFDLAKAQYLQYTLGKNIQVSMIYSSKLESFGNWVSQLIAESLGKKYDLEDNQVNVGITPLTAIGVRDQHSLLQLFQEGPDDKFYIFIKPKHSNETLIIPKISYEGLEYLAGVGVEELVDAEYQGVVNSLLDTGRPIVEIGIDKIDEWHLGRLFMFFEMFTAILGEMLNVDTFNQPGVEASKKFAKAHLE